MTRTREKREYWEGRQLLDGLVHPRVKSSTAECGREEEITDVTFPHTDGAKPSPVALSCTADPPLPLFSSQEESLSMSLSPDPYIIHTLS